MHDGIMNNDDKLRAISIWNKVFHPLTCGSDNCSNVLKGVIENNNVILKCQCGFKQNHIPEVVYDYYKKHM